MTKNQKILQVATKLFLEAGFSNISMDLVSKKAKVSKATVYAHFKSKEELFLKCLDSYRGKHNIVYPILPKEVPSSLEELEKILTAYFSQSFDYFTNAAHVDFMRVLIAELPVFPDLFKFHFAASTTHITSNLSDYLALYYEKYNPSIIDKAYTISCNITDMLRGQSLWIKLLKNPKREPFLKNKKQTIKDLVKHSILIIKNS